MMKWVGLTGGIATGKSTVAKILRDLGYVVVDADQLARQLTQPGTPALQEIQQAFGREMVQSDGQLDRSRLAKFIFNNAAERTKLEGILHPKIQELRAKEKHQIEQAGHELAFYDVPLLFEKNMEPEFDAVVLVYASVDEQIKRLAERDHLSTQEIDIRLQSQMPIDDKRKLANYVIINQGSLAELKLNVQSVIMDIIKGSADTPK